METFFALLAICAGNSPVPVNYPHKGQCCGALMFSLIYAWINDWVNNREAGDLRCHRGHCDVDVMNYFCLYIYICIHNRSDVTWASWRFKSPTPQLFVHQECFDIVSTVFRLVWVVIDRVIDRPTDWLNVDIAWPLLALDKTRSDQIKQIR